MEEKRLDLSDRDFIQGKLRQLDLCLSDYSFVTLFLYRKKREILLVKDTVSYLKGLSRDGEKIIIPLDSMELGFDVYSQLLLEGSCQYLYPIPEKHLLLFQKGPFFIEEKVEWSDYIYQTKKMSTYPGRSLAGRRNLVKQFKIENSYEVVAFSDNLKEKAIDLLKEWKNEHEVEGDYLALLEALNLLEPLYIQGIGILIDGELSAFTLGSELKKDVFDIHFGKARRGVKGIYQTLYQELALSLDPQFKWMNFEQDLGLPGLRESKRQYIPDHMERVWKVGIKR
ncbi:phosphatidylglycerol lysyltransferase domain-containing protein [Chlamydiales bacterium]|nr:phosphatidylglycerol lysyltransferase domain-containing protein [Chlamydiales bacterium]